VARGRSPWRRSGHVHPGGMAGYGSKRLHKESRDNVGKGPVAAGAGSNLQRPCTDGESGGGRRDGVRRMSLYERGRRGNALPGDLRGRLCTSNARVEQRGSGHSVASCLPARPDAELESRVFGWCEAKGGSQLRSVRGVCEPALEPRRPKEDPSPTNGVQSRGQNRTREIRPSGIAGGPVGTWLMAELGPHLATERARLVTLRLPVRASQIYPDICTHGSTGRGPETGPRN
jgi:hypothetical protein